MEGPDVYILSNGSTALSFHLRRHQQHQRRRHVGVELSSRHRVQVHHKLLTRRLLLPWHNGATESLYLPFRGAVVYQGSGTF